VAKHIFDKCINGYLQSKVCVLVTHQLQFIEKATQILVLKDGNCVSVGNYKDLVNSNLDFISLLGKEKEELKPVIDTQVGLTDLVRVYKREVSFSASSISSAAGSVRSLRKESDGDLSGEADYVPQIAEEEKELGSVKSKIYWDYCRAGAGPLFLTLTLFSTLLSQFTYHASDWFLTLW